MTLCYSALKIDDVLVHIVVRVFLVHLIKENAAPHCCPRQGLADYATAMPFCIVLHDKKRS